MTRQRWTKGEVDKQWALAHWLNTDQGIEYVSSRAAAIPDDTELFHLLKDFLKERKVKPYDKG